MVVRYSLGLERANNHPNFDLVSLRVYPHNKIAVVRQKQCRGETRNMRASEVQMCLLYIKCKRIMSVMLVLGLYLAAPYMRKRRERIP